MFKKTTFAALAAAVVLTFSTATSFANPYYHGGGHHRMNGDHGGYIAERMEQMTPDQKNAWKDWKQKSADLEKKIISKQVEWNWMTPEQGKARLERIDNWVKNDQPMTRKWDGNRQNDSDSRPYHKNNENYGHGGRGYNHWNNENDRPSKNFSEDRQKKFDYQASLADEQKTQLQTWKTEKAELKKEWVNLQYSWGWITKEQAEYRITRLDDWAEKSFFHPYDAGGPYHNRR